MSSTTRTDAAIRSTMALVMACSGIPLSAGEEPPEWTKDSPLALSLGYSAVSDYVFRGINFSEYPGEGAEDLNHQLTATFAIETPVGNLGASGWFEWFAGQDKINPNATNKLQEIDYTLFWNYTYAPAGTTLELGWTAYTFPHLAGDAFATYEGYGKVSLDDGVIFGTPIMKPFVFWAFDYDLGNDGSWIQLGGSHDFTAADVGARDCPVLKDLTVTPSVAVAFDWRYLNNFALEGPREPHRTVANVLYGLNLAYNLSSALKIPRRNGTITVGGFLNYSQAVRRDLLDDELFGGGTIAYSW